MAITYLMIVIFMAILGIVFSCGKGAMLIAGYNTASPEERAEMDEKQLCRFMGKFCFAMAGGWLIATVGVWLKQDSLHIGENRPVLHCYHRWADLCQYRKPI